MLADLLEESTPQLIQRAQARATGRSAPETPPARGRSGPIPALLALLVSTLRSQRVDVPLCASFNDIGVEVEPFLAMVNLLKDAVYDLIEERGSAVSPREMRLLTEWFAALAERARRAEVRRFSAMLDALPDYISMRDAAGRFIYLNRATAEALGAVTGRSRQDLLGLTPQDLSLDEEIQRFVQAVHERVLGGEAVAEEVRLPEALGGRWHEHHVMPIHDSQGRIEAAVVAGRDIHARKAAEARLAQEVTFREHVMGILGHDLRNPLSSVLALSELLALQDGLPDRIKEGLQHIRQAAERMKEMIATILDFTSIRFCGAPPLSPEPLELDALARTIVDELRIAHPDHEILIDTKGDLRGRWDRGRVGQVISNLVGNALVHGARESPVRVSLAGENGCGTIAVSNRGPTIPQSDLDRLFEPFWQAPEQGEVRPRGLGLGLFIVRQIVHAHGGEIAVRSQDGVTTFTVRLPHVPAVASNFDEADPAQGAEWQGR